MTIWNSYPNEPFNWPPDRDRFMPSPGPGRIRPISRPRWASN